MRFPLLLCLPLLLLCGCRTGAEWSPDGKQIALDPRGYLVTFDTATKQFKQHTRGPQKAIAPAWSPDGSKLVYYRLTVKGANVVGMDLISLDLAAGRHAMLVPRAPLPPAQDFNLSGAYEFVRELVQVAYSPDGSKLAYLAYGGDQPTLWVSNADGTHPRQILEGTKGALQLAWSPDSSRIALFSAAETPDPNKPGKPPAVNLDVVNPDGTARRTLWDGTQGPLAALGPIPAWSPDGKTIRVAVDTEIKGMDPFPRATEIWDVPASEGKPSKVGSLGAPSPFLSFRPGGAGYFPAPKDENEEAPSIAFVDEGFQQTRILGKLDAAALGLKENAPNDFDRFPIPSLSPDSKQTAFAYVPKTGAAMLLLQSTEGGKLARYGIPLITPSSPAPAPKKPAPKKPAPKKPAPRKR
jgi:hypothetical protein